MIRTADLPRPNTTARAAGAFALFLLPASAAWAGPTGAYQGYFVTGSAEAYAPGSGQGAAYQCNTLGTAAALGGCGGLPTVRTPGSYSYTGSTVDSTGRTTSYVAQTQTVAAINNVLDPNTSATTRATANLATASVGASVVDNPTGGALVTGSAFTDLHDTVNLHVTGASAATLTRVLFQITLAGSFTDTGATTIFGEPGSGGLGISFALDRQDSGFGNGGLYGLYANAGWDYFRGAVTGAPSGSIDNRGTMVGGNWTSFGLNGMVFDGYFDILGSDAVINPYLSMRLDCSIGMQCDYSNGLQFRFVQLPGSVSFTSNSGTFLSAVMPNPNPNPNPSVPEPTTLGLLLAGLGAIGLRRTKLGRTA